MRKVLAAWYDLHSSLLLLSILSEGGVEDLDVKLEPLINLLCGNSRAQVPAQPLNS